MSVDWGKIISGFLGGGGPPVNPGGFVPPPQPPNMGSNAGVSHPLGQSSGLSAYAAPPMAQPSFMPSSQGMSQYNMAGNLSGPVGSTVQPQGQSDDGGTPWYKNPAILNTIAGAGSMLLQNHNESQNRAQQQQRIDLEKQQYADQHARQQQTSQAIDPIIARLLGQMAQRQSPSNHQG
jgi:hypothetical protein